MKILFVADGRSPIALNWIRHFIGSAHEVHFVSTFPADPDPGLASFTTVPVAFSGAAADPGSRSSSLVRRLTTPGLRTFVRQRLGALTLQKAADRLADRITEISPDIIHAMRIPYEGMIASIARPEKPDQPPLLISIWGNDFTMHAQANRVMAVRTRQSMQAASAVHADCRRDIRLAYEWGFSKTQPFIVLPGGGGVQPDLFYPPETPGSEGETLNIVQPRGMRAYVQNQAFFRSIPLVLERHAHARFFCPAMQGEKQVEAWVREMGIGRSVELLPKLSRPAMADLFRQSRIMVSPTIHDGTPNTLLEALACGCFPVAGNIESIREWINDGENGLLVDPEDPESIAGGLINAIESPSLLEDAKRINTKLIRSKADYSTVMSNAEDFYRLLISG